MSNQSNKKGCFGLGCGGLVLLLLAIGGVSVLLTPRGSLRPSGTADTSTPASPPVAKPPLPDGSFYLLRHTSVATNHGVVGVPVETVVERVADKGESVSVTNGPLTFEVRKEFLTTDPSAASRGIANDAEQQRALAERAKASQAVDAAKQRSAATPARTGRKITVGGYLASPSEELLDKAITYSVQRDEAALSKLMASGLVIPLKAGLPVEIVDTKIFSGKVKIRPRGETVELWTVMEAVKDE